MSVLTEHRARRVESLILYDGDHYRQVTEALQAVYAAEADAEASTRTAKHGDGDPVAAARAEYDRVEAMAADGATRASVGTLGRRQWRSLVNEHPPRPGNESDKASGYDVDSFPDAVVNACLVEPEFATAADRDAWLDDLTEGELTALFSLAYGLNVAAPDPKAHRPPGSRI